MTETARYGNRPTSPLASDGGAGQWVGDHVEHPGDEHGTGVGIDPVELADEDLLRELASLHRTRLHTLRHGPDAALNTHLRRTAELETEYLVRHPGREVDPSRLTQDV